MAVAVIVILIVVLIVVAVLLIRLCKSRLGRGSSSIHSDKITSINGSMTTLQSPYTGGTVVGKYNYLEHSTSRCKIKSIRPNSSGPLYRSVSTLRTTHS